MELVPPGARAAVRLNWLSAFWTERGSFWTAVLKAVWSKTRVSVVPTAEPIGPKERPMLARMVSLPVTLVPTSLIMLRREDISEMRSESPLSGPGVSLSALVAAARAVMRALKSVTKLLMFVTAEVSSAPTVTVAGVPPVGASRVTVTPLPSVTVFDAEYWAGPPLMLYWAFWPSAWEAV